VVIGYPSFLLEKGKQNKEHQSSFIPVFTVLDQIRDEKQESTEPHTGTVIGPGPNDESPTKNQNSVTIYVILSKLNQYRRIPLKRSNMQGECTFRRRLPIPTRVPTVNSEKSIFHSSYGSRDLWNVCAPTILFHVETISSLGLCSDLKFLSKFRTLYPCGDEGKDIAF